MSKKTILRFTSRRVSLSSTLERDEIWLQFVGIVELCKSVHKENPWLITLGAFVGWQWSFEDCTGGQDIGFVEIYE